MPRCRCTSTQSVLLRSTSPIVTVGQGTAESPFLVTLTWRGARGCDGVALCVSEHIGSGLEYRDGVFAVKVSKDADNAIVLRPDGSLHADPQTPAPDPCPDKSVAGLCQAGQLSVGAWRMGGLASPQSSPMGVDYLLGIDIDVIHMHTHVSLDGVVCITDNQSGVVSPIRAEFPPNRVANFPLNRVGQMSSATFRNAYSRAGDATHPNMMYEAVSTTAAFVYSRGPWWGWKAQQYTPMFLSEVYQKVGGRAVILADCDTFDRSTANYSDESATAVFDEQAVELANALAVIRTAQEYCALPWTLIGIRYPANAAPIIAAGGTPIAISCFELAMNSDPNYIPWGVSTWTSVGVNWIALDAYLDDTSYNAFRTAGFNILMQNGTRHIDRTRCARLGICGFLSGDPVYTRGIGGARNYPDYRTRDDPFRYRTCGTGMLTHWNRRHTFSASTGQLSRGYMEADTPDDFGTIGPGLVLDYDFGTIPDTPFGGGNPVGRSTPTVLAGWACPIATPTNYNLVYETRFRGLPGTANASAKLGVFFACDDDRDVFAWPTGWRYYQNVVGEVAPNNRASGYIVYLRADGNMGIIRRDKTGSILYLRGANSNTVRTGMEVSVGTIVANRWYLFEVFITTSGIEVVANVPDTGQTFTTNATGANATSFRGPYFHLMKEQLDTSFSQQCLGAFRNIIV